MTYLAHGFRDRFDFVNTVSVTGEIVLLKSIEMYLGRAKKYVSL